MARGRRSFARVRCCDLDQAVASAREAVQLEPQNDEYREALAVYLVQGQRFTEALEVIRPVDNGRHPFAVLLSDFEALPIPDEALYSPLATESFAQQQVMRGRFDDYAEFRVRVYLVPMTADEVERFYRRHWPDVQLFELARTRSQYLRIGRAGLEPAVSRTDIPQYPADAGGMLLSVVTIEGPDALAELTDRFRLEPIELAPDACLLYAVNYRSMTGG